MRDLQAPASLHAALRFVITSEIPGDHKAVIIDALTQALRDGEAATDRRKEAEDAGGPWQTHEITQVESYLQGKTAKSWQHADELLTHLSSQLHRSPRDVRAKALELGFGIGVDYTIARAQARAQSK